MDTPTQTFLEDRSDVMWRAMPRLAVGLGATYLAIAGAIFVVDHRAPMVKMLGLVALLWVVSLLIRFDVFALQFGRRIRYEVSDERFEAYRGSKLVDSFRLSAVTEWTAASSASTFEYWLGWGSWRSAALPLALSPYSFKVRDAGNEKTRTVEPPALFRWKDRGGLEDVTRALIERLGPPVNYSINYRLEQ